MSLICKRMKSHFHIKGWAPRLALWKRFKEIRKWPISYYRYRTGTSLQLRLMWGIFSNVTDIFFFYSISPMSLHCKLVPVLYRKWTIEVSMAPVIQYQGPPVDIIIVLCSWKTLYSHSASHSTQVYKWELRNCRDNHTKCICCAPVHIYTLQLPFKL